MTDTQANQIRPSVSPFLSGNFAPVTEEVTAFDLPVVQGAIPADLDGRYLRNGPNPVAPDPADYHWFTGTGMVHGIRLRDGKAEWYRNRFVRAGEINQTRGWDDLPGPEGVMQGSVNTNVVGQGGRTFAVVEAGSYPIELTDELESVARCDFSAAGGPGLRGPFSAHPKRDPDTGDLHTAAYFWGFDGMQYVVVDADAQVSHEVTLDLPGKPMIHDLSITESRVVMYDLPCTFDVEVAMTGEWPYLWNPEYGARIGVLPKFGTNDDVRWFEVENCYVFHPMNAHDLPNGDIAIDLVRHPAMFDRNKLGPMEGASTLERWTIDMAAGKVREERRDDRSQEFPRVDERLVGKPARYGLSTIFEPEGDAGLALGSMLRHDLVAGTAETHDFGPGRAAGEGVFVPRTPDAAEDDGWIMTVVYDRATDGSQMVLLDAQDFTGEPVCVVDLPQRVPFGFHGNWVPTGR